MEAINICDNTWRDFTRACLDHCRVDLRAKLHQAHKQVKHTENNAKDLWLEKICVEADQKDAFHAWGALKTINQGFCGHYSKQRTF